jgi:segregation and condensation protein B
MPKDSHTHRDETPLKNHIEAILFWRGDPMTATELAKFTFSTKEEVAIALAEVKNDLHDRGIVLIEHEGEYTLGTNPASSKLIESVRKEELSRELGKAGLETLAIVLYQGPVRRSEIDYIRGVNSNFILRNLLIRGLIERKPAPNDARASVYTASMELIRHLGLTNISELPDFEIVKNQIAEFKDVDKNADSDGADGSPMNDQSDTDGIANA